VLPRFSINQEKKDKRKLSILPTYFLVVKSIAPCAAAFRPAYICEFKKLARKKIIRKKNSRAKFIKIIMFLLTVQQNIQIFSFFSAIFRMLRFSKREKSTEKKINER
jgi:hypothetical protein